MAEKAQSVALLDYFSGLEDPRQAGKVLFPLDEIMLVVLCGVLSGADGFVEIARWGEMQLGFLRRFLPYTAGIPSHDALNDLFNALDHQAFRDRFVAWVQSLRVEAGQDAGPEIVAIDGKTSRRTGDKRKGRPALHMVSAWASRQRLVLGQEEPIKTSTPRRTRSWPSPSSWRSWNSRVPWSPSTPWDAKRPSPKRSATRAPTTSCRSRATSLPWSRISTSSSPNKGPQTSPTARPSSMKPSMPTTDAWKSAATGPPPISPGSSNGTTGRGSNPSP